ncbi:hypothetical protein HJG54_33740 [Leptolyngbya sp. NK1-12]|uniref:Uncharacterized protein n=1 Tax=Leptolyngbya sp. NK1-12 TaxID=2547451 RepID=A0AA97AJH1_9CYAN|nr:hypothetical protein [Leptolyngbya sp. NK1-12]WNZ27795.1 hypothetical protein HJG54_33740 [Leptolyngbya sp. NK1-12]
MFPTVEVDNQTRGGIVTAQYLLKNESPDSEYDYAWFVHWQNQGGSPFGSRTVPPDPAPQLAALAKTSFTRYTIETEQTQRTMNLYSQVQLIKHRITALLQLCNRLIS